MSFPAKLFAILEKMLSKSVGFPFQLHKICVKSPKNFSVSYFPCWKYFLYAKTPI